MNFKFYAALSPLTLHVVTPVRLEKTNAIYSVSIVLEVFILNTHQMVNSVQVSA